jgi:hypothetical protein
VDSYRLLVQGSSTNTYISAASFHFALGSDIFLFIFIGRFLQLCLSAHHGWHIIPGWKA